MVYIFLAEGFEEVEAIMPYDLLVRGKVDCKLVSITDNKTVTGARGTIVNAHLSLSEIDVNEAELIVLPGGMPGTTNLAACNELMKYVDEFAASDERRVAAICAAPARILGQRGLLKGKKAICYPGMEDEMEGAIVTVEKVVTDGNITTSRGLGTALEFGLELLSLLKGVNVAEEVKKSVVA